MPRHISNLEADRLARNLARRKEETITEAVAHALRERLVRDTARPPGDLKAEIMAISRRASRIPRRRGGTDEEIIGYSQQGLPV